MIVLVTAGCGVTRTESPHFVALLAPFEGRYREIGYQALDAAQLALAQSRLQEPIDVLAVDDGGSVESAVLRARALSSNRQVVAVIVLGYAATDDATLSAFGDLPVIVAGHWGATSSADNIFLMAPTELPEALTISPRIDILDAAALEVPLVGGEIFALEQLADLRNDLTGITLISSASLPDEDFRQRYLATDAFAPEPNLIATQTYEAMHWYLDGLPPREHPLYFYTYNEQGQLEPAEAVP
ncbi:MAG: hypothetical protein SF029_04130 [bacterium]|nr:hypothetical protein [bacterium]